MLARLWRRLIGKPDPDRSAPIDPAAIDVVRRQRNVAQRLSTLTGKTPEQLLDYRRADGLLNGGKR